MVYIHEYTQYSTIFETRVTPSWGVKVYTLSQSLSGNASAQTSMMFILHAVGGKQDYRRQHATPNAEWYPANVPNKYQYKYQYAK